MTITGFTLRPLLLLLVYKYIYRHDSIYFVGSYVDKLRSEGRWLNYLLFNVTPHIPGRVAVLSNLLFLFCLFFGIKTMDRNGILYIFAFFTALLIGFYRVNKEETT